MAGEPDNPAVLNEETDDSALDSRHGKPPLLLVVTAAGRGLALDQDRRDPAREPESMKTIARRLHRLDEGFGLQPETEFDRRLRADRGGQRRLVEARERGEVGPPETGPLVEVRRRRLTEAMLLGG